MSRIDFYILSQGGPDARLLCACRVAEKAVEEGARVYLLTASAADTRRLDELLWTWRDGSFLPHEIWSTTPASHDRVRIMLGETLGPDSHRDLLINLTEALPEGLEHYARVAEIVDVDAERKRTARERYKQYRERGCTLESHNL